MNKTYILIPVALLAALGAGITAWRHQASRRAQDTLYGNVDIREATLSFRVPGRVLEVAVDEGAAVKAGQVLASLDPEPLQNSLRATESAVAALKARHHLIQAGSRAEDVAQARARLASAQATLQEAERTLGRQRALVPAGAIAQSALDGAQTARDQAAAAQTVADTQLQALVRGFRPEERAEAEAHLRQAQAQLEAAQLALQDATLKAPIDGIVLTRAIERGTQVQAGTPAFSLSLVRPVWVRAYVNGPQMGRFAPGTAVALHTDARPGRPYAGTVGFVSPTAEFTPKPVETPDLRTSLVYRLRVVVQDPDDQLRQGMPVTIRRTQP